MARQFLVATNNWAGTDRRLLDEVGIVSNVQFKSMYPGGCSLLTCTLNMPAISAPLVVQAGRKVEVFNGATLVWAGKMSDPKRGEPWELSAVGMASLATTYTADNPTVQTAVDDAITRGLPWTRSVSLSSFIGTIGDGSQTLDQALTTGATGAGLVWKVSPTGAITSETYPTTVTHLAYPVNVPEATMSGYATSYVVKYMVSSSATATVNVTNAAAVARYGYTEKPLDLTGFGLLSSGQATTYGTQYLNRQVAMLTLSGPIVVMPGQLLTTQGAAVDLASVKAGIYVQVMTTDPGHSQLVDPTKPIKGVVVETAYDSVAETLSLSLAGEQRTDLVALMADAYRNSLYQRA